MQRHAVVSARVKSIISPKCDEGSATRKCVKPSHFKRMLISSGGGAYNNDDCSLPLSH